MSPETSPGLSLTVGPEALDRLFPFRVVVARNLSILEVGHTLARLLPISTPAALSFEGLFSVVRPRLDILTFEKLAALTQVVVVLRTRHGLQLQGQIERLGNDVLLFVGSPVVEDLAALRRMGLEVRDFPPHDSAGDYLLLLQSTKANMADLQRVTEDLRKQRAELLVTQQSLQASLLESRRSAEAQAESEHRYRHVVNTVKEVIFQTDADGRWTFLNPAWTETLGYPVEDSLGRIFFDFVHPEDRERNVQAFIPLIERQKDSCRHEVRYVTASGDVRWIEVFARLLLDDHGNSVGTAGTLNDVTERRVAIERLKEARERMAEAKTLAESSNQSKTDFLASMSHEIRTPLHVLLGMLDLMSETTLSDEQRQLMRAARNNANLLRYLVGDVLDFTKIEQGAIQLNLGPLDPVQLVREAEAFAAQLVNGKAIEIECRVEPTVPSLIRGDEMRVRQILLNLVTNAVKFTKRGKVTVGVSFEATPPHDGVIRFEVADTGLGISAADQPRLFQRFQRTHSGLRIAGTGLGLFISRSLIELMRGQIGLSSHEGVGSTFHFSVPCRVLESRPGKPRTNRQTTAPMRRAASARVLLVEDYESSQEFALHALRGVGHKVDIADTGAAALAFTTRCRYDMIFMDIHLPDFSGFEAARRIRAAETARGDDRVPIVAVTAHAVQGIEEQCADAGMDACATKPLSPFDLRRLVHQWADQRPTVFVADDSLDAQALSRRHLSTLGVRTVGASNGLEVIAQLERQPAAVVVMDLTMPDMDGLATMRAIRSQPRFASLPIVILSGVEDDGRRQQVQDLGGAAYLTKPVDRSVLLQVVSDALEQTGSESTMAPPVVHEADDLADLIPEYLNARWTDLEDARGALSTGAFDQVESIGHNMKGTGTSYGFEAITRLGRALEDAARARDAARALDVVAELEAVLSGAATESQDT